MSDLKKSIQSKINEMIINDISEARNEFHFHEKVSVYKSKKKDSINDFGLSHKEIPRGESIDHLMKQWNMSSTGWIFKEPKTISVGDKFIMAKEEFEFQGYIKSEYNTRNSFILRNTRTGELMDFDIKKDAELLEVLYNSLPNNKNKNNNKVKTRFKTK